MKRRITIAVLLMTSFAIVGVAWLSYDYNTRNWVKYQLFHRDYLLWKRDGGKMRTEFYEPLKLDPNLDSMVEGLSYAQIIAKFPFLTDGDTYPRGSYKGEYLANLRDHDSFTGKVLWFREKDDFDWCIVVAPEGNTIRLIKG